MIASRPTELCRIPVDCLNSFWLHKTSVRLTEKFSSARI
jgi:hypothetical protein